MANFDSKRAEAIRKKNDAYAKAVNFEKQSEAFDEKRKQVTDSRSRIPDDLPEDIKKQIEAMYEQKEEELNDEAEDIADNIKEAMDDANEAISEMQSLGDELGKKADSLSGLKNVPLIGEFLEHKGEQLEDQKVQLFDLAKEAQQYSDKLAESRNRILKKS